MGAGGDKVEVGLVHNVFWTEPKSHGPLYAHVRCSCTPLECRSDMLHQLTSAHIHIAHKKWNAACSKKLTKVAKRRAGVIAISKQWFELTINQSTA